MILGSNAHLTTVGFEPTLFRTAVNGSRILRMSCDVPKHSALTTRYWLLDTDRCLVEVMSTYAKLPFVIG